MIAAAHQNDMYSLKLLEQDTETESQASSQCECELSLYGQYCPFLL